MVVKYGSVVFGGVLEELLRCSRADSVTINYADLSMQGGFDLLSVELSARSRAPQNRVNYEIVRTYQVKRQGARTDLLTRNEEIGLLAFAYGLRPEFGEFQGEPFAMLFEGTDEIPVAILNGYGLYVVPSMKNFMPSREARRFYGVRFVDALHYFFGMAEEPSLDVLDEAGGGLEEKLRTDLLIWRSAKLRDRFRIAFPSEYIHAFGAKGSVMLEQVLIEGKPAIRVADSEFFRRNFSGEPVQDVGEVLYQRRVSLARSAMERQVEESTNMQGHKQYRLVIPSRCRDFMGVRSIQDELLIIGPGDPNYFFIARRADFPDYRTPLKLQLPM